MLHALQTAPSPTKPAVTRSAQAKARAERPLVCERCRARITAKDARLEVGGKHLHTCANPHGIVYRIACFRDAPGCRPLGGRTAYWSWFPGYTWEIALCASCDTHLGWRFQSGADAFFGLIVERLADGEEPKE